MSRHLRVFVDLVSAVASTISISAQLVAENISEGRVSREMDGLLDNEDGLFEVDRALRILIRCGAIQPQKEPIEEDREMVERRAVESVIYLLRAVVEGRSGAGGEKESVVKMEEKTAPEPAMERTAGALRTGAYHVSQVKPERVAQIKSDQIKLPVAAPETEDMPFDGSGEASSSPAGTHPSAAGMSSPDQGAREDLNTEKDGTTDRIAYARKLIKGLVHDSLVPAPESPIRPQNWGSIQMWLAIGLAILILGMLIAGLVLIGTGAREDDMDHPPAMEGAQNND
jgi:hypothetical protein